MAQPLLHTVSRSRDVRSAWLQDESPIIGSLKKQDGLEV
jgi:hypothetical protein